MDALRSLLERGGEKLTSSTHMAQYIPQIAAREKGIVMHEIKGEKGSLIFDGTTRLGEAIVALWRQCNGNFVVQTRLAAFRTTETHTTGEGLYRLLCTVLLGDLGKLPKEVIGDARDSCATHIVAGLAIYARSTMAQTGVSGPMVVDEESFLDALFASAGQG